MAKTKTVYRCTDCGADYSKWQGRCDTCGGWNTLVEEAAAPKLPAKGGGGSARRMGPGYMPMLVFWIQIALGAVVLIASFFNGPDPLERWTGLDAGSLAGGVVAGGA